MYRCSSGNILSYIFVSIKSHPFNEDFDEPSGTKFFFYIHLLIELYCSSFCYSWIFNGSDFSHHVQMHRISGLRSSTLISTETPLKVIFGLFSTASMSQILMLFRFLVPQLHGILRRFLSGQQQETLLSVWLEEILQIWKHFTQQ